jgi:hypothetical protein
LFVVLHNVPNQRAESDTARGQDIGTKGFTTQYNLGRLLIETYVLVKGRRRGRVEKFRYKTTRKELWLTQISINPVQEFCGELG